LPGFSKRRDGRLEQVGLQNVEIARRPQDLAEPANVGLDRLDRLASQQGAVDLDEERQAAESQQVERDPPEARVVRLA